MERAGHGGGTGFLNTTPSESLMSDGRSFVAFVPPEIGTAQDSLLSENGF